MPGYPLNPPIARRCAISMLLRWNHTRREPIPKVHKIRLLTSAGYPFFRLLNNDHGRDHYIESNHAGWKWTFIESSAQCLRSKTAACYHRSHHRGEEAFAHSGQSCHSGTTTCIVRHYNWDAFQSRAFCANHGTSATVSLTGPLHHIFRHRTACSVDQWNQFHHPDTDAQPHWFTVYLWAWQITTITNEGFDQSRATTGATRTTPITDVHFLWAI